MQLSRKATVNHLPLSYKKESDVQKCSCAKGGDDSINGRKESLSVQKELGESHR